MGPRPKLRNVTTLAEGPRPEWAKRKGPEAQGPDDCETRTRKDGAFGWH